MRDSRFIRLLLILFFFLAIGYAAYEAQGLFFGPEIHLAESATSSHKAFNSIKGRVERITELRLNGKTISVTEGGEFNEPYLLAEGANRLILEARDARGRTTTKTLDIIYIAPDVSAVSESMPSEATSSPATTSPTDAL